MAQKFFAAQMTGKVVLVTGGSSGIGKAAALAFAQAGAKVVIASRTPEKGQAAVKAILDAVTGPGAEVGADAPVCWIQADTSRAAQVEALVQETLAAYGRLDYAFNNGGSGGMGGWLPEIQPDEWDKTIDGFLKSVYLCMKYEIPAMLKSGGGAIVNNSSVDGKRAFPWDPAYSAAKHGVLGLTKSTAMQYADRGLRINAVCPGWIKTPPTESIIAQDPQAEARLLQHQPIGRLGSPEEVAQAVVWLCSDQASFILGTALDVDGGYCIL